MLQKDITIITFTGPKKLVITLAPAFIPKSSKGGLEPKMYNDTDLGSLTGNFDCGYSTVLKFPATLFLCKTNVGCFQNVKICHFNNFEGFEF